MSDSASRRRWRWSLIIAALVLFGAVQAAAAAWAQMPWRQVPVNVLSLWLGAALPMTLTWAGRTAAPNRRKRRPGRRSKRTGPEEAEAGKALEFPWTPEPVDLTPAMHSLAGGVVLYLLTIVSQVSDSVREWFLPQAETGFSLEIVGMLLISGSLVGVSLQLLHAAQGGAAILVDAGGFTVSVGQARCRVLWREVDGLTTEGRFLIVESSVLSKRRARDLNVIVGRRQGHEQAMKLWSPQRPRATVCDLKTLTVPKNRLFKAIKKHWGGEIARGRAPQ